MKWTAFVVVDMAHIAILGLGNWGTAIARMWLADGHHVKGWTIEGLGLGDLGGLST
jgi:glycerol-3-phosphate dehydrogenase